MLWHLGIVYSDTLGLYIREYHAIEIFYAHNMYAN